MVHVPESLPACLTRVVLPYWIRVWVGAGAGVGIGTRSRNRVRGCDWDWDLNWAGKGGVLASVVGWRSLQENGEEIYSLSEFLTLCEFWEGKKSLIHENNLLLTSNTHHRTSVSVNIQSIEWGNGSVMHWYWGLWGFWYNLVLTGAILRITEDEMSKTKRDKWTNRSKDRGFEGGAAVSMAKIW